MVLMKLQVVEKTKKVTDKFKVNIRHNMTKTTKFCGKRVVPWSNWALKAIFLSGNTLHMKPVVSKCKYEVT